MRSNYFDNISLPIRLPRIRLFVRRPQQADEAEKHSQLPALAFETSYGDGDDVVLLFAIMSQRADPSSTKIIHYITF